MYIVHIASEFAPFAKVGGLGDALLGLTKAFQKNNHQVQVLLPKYAFLDYEKLGAAPYQPGVLTATYHNVNLFFIETPHCFEESTIYTGDDRDAPRFISFTKYALKFLLSQNKKIDILHLHDWHSAIAAPLIKLKLNNLTPGAVALNIHNLCYQGECEKELVKEFPFETPNLLKEGINYADAVIFVSPNYSKEVLTEEYACGLLQTLKKNEKKLYGVLNGIDHEMWDPEIDPALALNYSNKDSLNKIIHAKQKNKELTQEELQLKKTKAPLVTCITRLVHQKGPELIEKGLLFALEKGAQCVLLGSSPDKDMQGHFENLAEKYKDNTNIHFHFKFNDKLSRLLYAASDFIVMPSQFEPCGITQLIALRYGSIPIVRKTGGLKDTVFDLDDPDIPTDLKNGFLFTGYSSKDFNQAIYRALNAYKDQSTHTLIKQGMDRDYSWKKSALQYQDVYEKIL